MTAAATTAAPGQWLVPDWPAPATVRAVFTTRGSSATEGASAPPFEHFNLGDHVGDAPAAVAANRAALQTHIGARAVFLNQVHGTGVQRLQANTADGTTADAAATSERALACTIMVADCLPVLFTDRQGRAVAAAHAGWRGLAGGVLERTLECFRSLTGAQTAQTAMDSGANELLAWLGPCIGPQAFEVGPEVREAFLAADPGAGACFAPAGPGGKLLADLPALARRRLAAAGVGAVWGNDGSPSWCTVAQAQRYFSYRRDQAARGGTGRMAACIWRA